ncbi:hypothetical protein MLD38_018760 [Melastoma candidum]|uniref:Uncharacterized protein n=1 Tax=Melastoma candidum TaxID=119954 RepID=A0ACB9QUW0_9MYRT|nr:hypothetical protein MLD38_018760 [Melastoma candidum]
MGLCSLPIMKLIKFKFLSIFPEHLFRRSGRSFPSSNHLNGSTTSSSSSSSSASVLTRRDLEAMLGRLGAGRVGIDELVRRLGSVCGGGGGGEEEELRLAFGSFDEDGDGRITAEELLGYWGGGVMGDEGCILEDCRRMLVWVDGNRDGFVCFKDFSRMM